MSLPVPPKVVRRILRDPLWPLLIGTLCLLLGLAAIPCLLLAPFTKRHRALRLVRVGLASLVLDLRLVFGCWRLWFVHPPWKRDSTVWRQAHVDLLGRALQSYIDIVARTTGLRLRTDVDIPEATDRQPLLVLARHVGSGDSLIVVHLVVNVWGRQPRVMLKRFLLWDAAVDLLLGRLDCYFLPPRHLHVTERDRQLEAFARSLDSADALILFPEGGNWSRKRHAESMEWAARQHNSRLRDWIADHPRVLAPRAKGTREMLEENPHLAPVIVTHRGLESTGSPRQIWSSLPLHDPVDVLARAVERPPNHDLDDVEQWLQHYWSRIDRWAGD